MAETDAEMRRQARREAAPALVFAILLLVLLAIVSRVESWELLSRMPWWTWLFIAIPELLLVVDLSLGARGPSFAKTRQAAVVLLGVLVCANLVALAILIASLVTTDAQQLGGGELLLSAIVVWANNVIVFGLLFWELDHGGPVERMNGVRSTPDFQFPQDENPGLAVPGWRSEVWDYLYLSLTNSIAFSPTDAMPLSPSAKRLMGLGAMASAVTVLLVAARAVNVLGS